MTLTCAGCGEEFEARRRNARWCSDRCRKSARRKASVESDAEVEPSVVDAAGDGAEHEPTAESVYGRDVLDAVRRDLEKAGRLDTVDGRVAMYLARKSIDPDAKNPAALFKQMREALATALEGAEVEGSPAPTEPEPDEVTKARERRDQKARKAANR